MKTASPFTTLDPMEQGMASLIILVGIAAGYYQGELEIFVSDPDRDRIQVFDEFGTHKITRLVVIRVASPLTITDQSMWRMLGTSANAFDRNGTFLRSITGISGDPWGLSIRGNRLAVGNSHGSVPKVRIYDLNGSFIKEFGSGGMGAGEFNQPRGVSFAPNGDLWVADHVNHRVQIFDGNGTYLRQIGNLAENPGLSSPTAVAMDLSNYYLSDTENDRVVVMSQADGSHVRTIAVNGANYNQVSNPKGIALDGYGRIYVADNGNNRVQVFENNGTFVRSIGGSGILPIHGESRWRKMEKFTSVIRQPTVS